MKHKSIEDIDELKSASGRIYLVNETLHRNVMVFGSVLLMGVGVGLLGLTFTLSINDFYSNAALLIFNFMGVFLNIEEYVRHKMNLIKIQEVRKFLETKNDQKSSVEEEEFIFTLLPQGKVRTDSPRERWRFPMTPIPFYFITIWILLNFE